MSVLWRSSGKILVSMTVIGVITFSILEGTLELMMRNPAYAPAQILSALRLYYYAEDQAFIQYLPECYRYDDLLTYTLRPGICSFAGREFDTQVSVNSLGVRDDEASIQSPEILVLGDSIAMGWGVQQGETFADILEGETQNRVLNMGISSYGTVREMEIAKRVNTEKLKVLIIQYSSNDLRENKTFFDSGNILPISSRDYYEKEAQDHLQLVKYYFGKHTIWIIKQMIAALAPAPANNASEEYDEAFYFFHALTTKYRELTDQKQMKSGSVTLIVVIPKALGDAKIRKSALSKAGGVHETVGHIFSVGFPSGSFPLDQHLNAKGHRELAKLLIWIIRDNCSMEAGRTPASEPVENRDISNCALEIDSL